MKTAQETFDIISNHLLTQNQKSMDELHLCQFRHGNLKCAIGCLIEDIDYREAIENHNISWLISRDYLREYNAHQEMLESLRQVHDDHDIIFWKKELAKVAKQNNLEFKGD